MWGKEKGKKVDFDRHAGKTTMVAKGTDISGNITFEGGLLIEGVVKGNVQAKPGSEALLRLSEAGVIVGDIKVPNVVINGKVTGNVYSPGHVELASKAVVNGNVHYNLIEMVMGSQVNGALVHDQKETASKPPVPSVEVAPKEVAPKKVKAKPAEARGSSVNVVAKPSQS